VDLHFNRHRIAAALQGLVRLENVEATFALQPAGNCPRLFCTSIRAIRSIRRSICRAHLLIRDYTVHVYVYGTSLAPEAVFSSEPPLPQEEIISLLATGVTRGELIGTTMFLAGRAAMLLVQQLYQKVFKKGQATKSNSAF